MNLAVRVQHHPSRAHLIPSLLERLAGFDDVAVIPDPDPDVRFGAWASHRACLEAIPETATHLFVIQEDAQPRDSLIQRVNEAIATHPEEVLLAFVPGFPRDRQTLIKAQAAGQKYAPFIIGPYVPTVAIIYPRAVVEGLLTWADTRGKDRYRRPMKGADDGIVANYCRLRRIHPLSLVPCLVEHDELLPSISKKMKTGPHRRAALL